MHKGLDQPHRSGLWLNLSLAVGATLLMNALIFALGWNTTTDWAPRAPFAPPDGVIAGVWVLLLALLAVARWWLNASQDAAVRRAKACITALMVSCLLWPMYSLAIGSLLGSLLGTFWAVGLAGFTLFQIRGLWKRQALLAIPAVLLVLPLALWLSFAALIVTKQSGWF